MTNGRMGEWGMNGRLHEGFRSLSRFLQDVTSQRDSLLPCYFDKSNGCQKTEIGGLGGGGMRARGERDD